MNYHQTTNLLFLCVWVFSTSCTSTSTPNRDVVNQQNHISTTLTTQDDAPAYVQIVNATSAAAISVKTDGQLYLRKLPQGLFTGDAAINKLTTTYTIINTDSNLEVTETVSYEAGIYQSLILLGNFNSDSKDSQPVTFKVLSHEIESQQEPLRYRFLNGLASESIIVDSANGVKSAKPGELLEFYGQPATKVFPVIIGDHSIEVLIRQGNPLRNCTIVFYSKQGKPTFIRVYENTGESALAQEAER